MTKKTFPANVQHSERYYLLCLLTFIDGLTANEPHSQICDRLNAQGLKTPQGLDWTADTLKSVLKRIRNHRDYRSSFHSALLRLVFDGKLTVQQTQILFAMRTTGVF
jgi:hypothetical protein